MATAVRSGPALLAALLAVGCSRGPYPVAGQVSYDDGKPAAELAGYSIAFDSPEMKISSIGTIEPDGRYTLDYLKKADGAMPGTYKVTIFDSFQGAPDESKQTAEKPARKSKRPIGAKYADVGQTPLTATVEAKTNDIPLTVERP